ncbi:MAG: HAMP domain-containing sensor histidine kinase [Flavobacteriales bacterium]
MRRYTGFMRFVFMDTSPWVANLPAHSAAVIALVWPSLIPAVTFALIALGVCVSAWYYIRKQKKISAMRTDFTDNLTHELKTPMATIAVATDALRDSLVAADPEKVRHYADIIKIENRRMSEQVARVLRASRLEKDHIELNKQTVSLNEIVREAISHVTLIVKSRNGTIFDNLSELDVKVRVDPFYFGSVVANILENANKYSPQAPDIAVHTFSAGGFAHVAVSDKGLGISKADQKRIFSKFYRVSTGSICDVKGYGLGLAYVKRIVDMHRGSVGVQSEKGKGTTFTIKIPIN